MQTFSFVSEPWHRRALREGGSALLKTRAWHRFLLADNALKRAKELNDADSITLARKQMHRDLIVYTSLMGTC